MPLYHSVLSGLALGDSKAHTAFKRANISKEIGDRAINELCLKSIIQREKSKKIFTSWDEFNAKNSVDKFFFTTPFLRFWFAFVSPLFKGIRDGEYKEIQESFGNREQEFYQLPFIQLSQAFLVSTFEDDPIKQIGSYWDDTTEIDILAQTESGKTVVGLCKYTNAKLKKNDLTKLQSLCSEANIKADIFVLFSKRGYSNELKALKGATLKLFTVKSLKALL